MILEFIVRLHVTHEFMRNAAMNKNSCANKWCGYNKMYDHCNERQKIRMKGFCGVKKPKINESHALLAKAT